MSDPNAQVPNQNAPITGTTPIPQQPPLASTVPPPAPSAPAPQASASQQPPPAPTVINNHTHFTVPPAIVGVLDNLAQAMMLRQQAPQSAPPPPPDIQPVKWDWDLGKKVLGVVLLVLVCMWFYNNYEDKKALHASITADVLKGLHGRGVEGVNVDNSATPPPVSPSPAQTPDDLPNFSKALGALGGALDRQSKSIDGMGDKVSKSLDGMGDKVSKSLDRLSDKVDAIGEQQKKDSEVLNKLIGKSVSSTSSTAAPAQGNGAGCQCAPGSTQAACRHDCSKPKVAAAPPRRHCSKPRARRSEPEEEGPVVKLGEWRNPPPAAPQVVYVQQPPPQQVTVAAAQPNLGVRIFENGRNHLGGWRYSNDPYQTWYCRHGGINPGADCERDNTWLREHKTNQRAWVSGVATVASAGIVAGAIRNSGNVTNNTWNRSGSFRSGHYRQGPGTHQPPPTTQHPVVNPPVTTIHPPRGRGNGTVI